LTSLEFLPPGESGEITDGIPDGLPNDTPDTIIGWATITEDDFESGWGNFLEKTGNDSNISNKRYRSGSWSGLMRDGSEHSRLVTKELSILDYPRLRVNFWFTAKGLDEGEDFVLERKFDDGQGWVLIGDWARTDQGFQNENGWVEEIVTISTAGNENVQFRFRCNGNHNRDKIWIDDVIVSGESLVVVTQAPSMSGLVNLALNKPTEQNGYLHGGVSSFAVDGDTSWSSQIFTRLRGWWEVDLEAIASISHIKIYNSDNPWFLTDAYVSVLDSNKEIVTGHVITEEEILT